MKRDPDFNNTKLKKMVEEVNTAYSIIETCRRFVMITEKAKEQVKESGSHITCLSAWALICSEEFTDLRDKSDGDWHGMLEQFVSEKRAASVLLTYAIAMATVISLRKCYASVHEAVSGIILGANAFGGEFTPEAIANFLKKLVEQNE